jgi:hypothetical protein
VPSDNTWDHVYYAKNRVNAILALRGLDDDRAIPRSPHQLLGLEFNIMPMRIKSERLRAWSFSII